MDHPDEPKRKSLARRLKRGRDANGNLWVKLGGLGLVASFFSLGSSATAAGFGFALSFALLFYGYHDIDISDDLKREDPGVKKPPTIPRP